MLAVATPWLACSPDAFAVLLVVGHSDQLYFVWHLRIRGLGAIRGGRSNVFFSLIERKTLVEKGSEFWHYDGRDLSMTVWFTSAWLYNMAASDLHRLCLKYEGPVLSAYTAMEDLKAVAAPEAGLRGLTGSDYEASDDRPRSVGDTVAFSVLSHHNSAVAIDEPVRLYQRVDSVPERGSLGVRAQLIAREHLDAVANIVKILDGDVKHHATALREFAALRAGQTEPAKHFAANHGVLFDDIGNLTRVDLALRYLNDFRLCQDNFVSCTSAFHCVFDGLDGAERQAFICLPSWKSQDWIAAATSATRAKASATLSEMWVTALWDAVKAAVEPALVFGLDRARAGSAMMVLGNSIPLDGVAADPHSERDARRRARELRREDQPRAAAGDAGTVDLGDAASSERHSGKVGSHSHGAAPLKITQMDLWRSKTALSEWDKELTCTSRGITVHRIPVIISVGLADINLMVLDFPSVFDQNARCVRGMIYVENPRLFELCLKAKLLESLWHISRSELHSRYTLRLTDLPVVAE